MPGVDWASLYDVIAVIAALTETFVVGQVHQLPEPGRCVHLVS